MALSDSGSATACLRTPLKDEYKRFDDGVGQSDGSIKDNDEVESEERHVASGRPCSIWPTGERMFAEGLFLALAKDPSERETVAMVGCMAQSEVK